MADYNSSYTGSQIDSAVGKALSPDTTPTENSTALITSGGVKSALTALETDLASIHATGSTNATGATITSGTYFYLDGTLVQALTDIADGATFTSGTNYEAVTAGGLNSLLAKFNGLVTVDTTSIKSYVSGNETRCTVLYGVYYTIGNLVFVQARITSLVTKTDTAVIMLEGLPRINNDDTNRYAKLNCFIFTGNTTVSEGPLTFKRNSGYVSMKDPVQGTTYNISGFYIKG